MDQIRRWTCAEVLSLIECFKKYPNLWDHSDVCYKSKMKKQNAYAEMAAVFKTNTTEIDRKIKNIVSQYQRERRYYKKFRKSRAGGNFIAKWFGYHAMRFMHVDAEGNDTWAEYQNSDSGDTEDLSEEAGVPALLCEVDMDAQTEEETTKPFSDTDTDQQGVFKPPGVKHKHVNQENRDSKNVLQTLESIFQSRNFIIQRDECDVFGEMVAQNLKQLKTEYGRITVQNRINNLLYEARLGHCDYPPNEVNTSMAHQYETSTKEHDSQLEF